MELYKGTIKKALDFKNQTVEEKVGFISYGSFLQLNDDFQKIEIPQKSVNFTALVDIIDYEITDEKGKEFVVSKIGKLKKWNAKEDILYEIITDNKGKKYGKELLTQTIFPLKNEVISLKTKLRRKKYSFEKYDVFLDATNSVEDIDVPHLEYLIEDSSDDNLRASKAEIDSYTDYRKGNLAKKKFAKKMVELSNCNVIETTFPTKEEIEAKSVKSSYFDMDIEIMSEIDNLLFDLKKISLESYNNYNNKFIELIDNKEELTLHPYSRQSLISLKSEIEVALLFSKNGNKDLKDYLLMLENEYFEGKETSISLEEYAKIALVLADSKTSMLEKRELIKLFAKDYMFEIKEEQIKEVTPLFEELRSTINYNLRCMIDEGLIETTLPVLNSSLDSDYLLKVVHDFTLKEKSKTYKRN